MLFRDFDFIFGDITDPATSREAHRPSRAFVEAVVYALRARRTEAPWAKLYLEIGTAGPRPRFWPALGNGMSAAGAYLELPEPELLTAAGSAVRPLIARTVTAARPTIRDASGWDDPWFWTMIDRLGSHQGPYSLRLKPVTDRKTGALHHLTYEWDETGTRLYVDARRGQDDPEMLGRVEIGDFPDQWEVLYGRVPSRLRLTPTGIELRDREGLVLRTIPRLPFSSRDIAQP